MAQSSGSEHPTDLCLGLGLGFVAHAGTERVDAF